MAGDGLVITLVPNSGIAVGPKRSGGLGIMVPKEGTAPADVVRAYGNPDSVATDHSEDGLAHTASKPVRGRLRGVDIGAWTDKAQPDVAQLTFGDGAPANSGSLPASVLPLYDIASASIDGVAYDTIAYTTQVPNVTNFPNLDTDEIVVNPETGVFFSGSTTTGSGAGIIFVTVKSPDWAKIREVFLTRGVRWIYLPFPATPQYSAVLDSHCTWGHANGIATAASFPDGVASPAVDATATFPDDITDGDTIKQYIEALPHDNLFFIGQHEALVGAGDDYGAGHAAAAASIGDAGSLHGQRAPTNLFFDSEQVYTKNEFGSSVTPNDDTFHELGANVVQKSIGGAFIYSSYRSSQPYDASGNYNHNHLDIFTKEWAVRDRLQNVIDSWITERPTSALFRDRDLAALRDRLLSATAQLAGEDIIDLPSGRDDIFVPSLADTLSADRAKNELNGAFIEVRFLTKVMRVNLQLGVGF